ncbi:hypothetical protein [Draconibacterium sediminis]|uniref:Uncharacterized protein n=1 Tax=Draconibacterium sediminis TaxID=1544798 RepID=A0A0D8J5L7_9BACT|nr:hypothetical protein [Draconibacterium sediminis]KJF42064.1 hypothetical protein LH29_22570 [Draconibacterium sediminis]
MTLNHLEISLIEEIIEANSSSFPELKEQLSRLNVSEREYTGVGIYVNFELDNQIEIYKSTIISTEILGSKTSFFVDSLVNEIAYELCLTQSGNFKFLEIVNNDGIDWNGKFKTFKKIKTVGNNL